MAFYIFLILTIIWFVFMTYLSHQDGEHTGRTSYELAERLSFLNMDTGMLNGKLRRAAHVASFSLMNSSVAKSMANIHPSILKSRVNPDSISIMAYMGIFFPASFLFTP